jgi:uncharacterized protein
MRRGIIPPWTALVWTLIFAVASPGRPSPTPAYGVSTNTSWLTMKDGVRLSVTFFRPVPVSPDERFPVLFDYYPYRKDEDPSSPGLYTYFARRGFITATVDVRGTGSSEGAVPDREYSERELEDGVEIIRQLAEMPGSNGRIGMWENPGAASTPSRSLCGGRPR